MKKILLLFAAINASISLFAQKAAIDSSLFGKWPTVEGGVISQDGNYVMYSIAQQPLDSCKLVVQSTDGTWKKQFAGVRDGEFTTDSKLAVFRLKDTICMLHLGTEEMNFIAGVDNYDLFQQDNLIRLIYKPTTVSSILEVLDLGYNKKREYDSVTDYRINDAGSALLVNRTTGLSSNLRSVEWIGLQDGAKKMIWESNKDICEAFVFDKEGKQVLFLTHNQSSKQSNIQVHYYKLGMLSAVQVANDQFKTTDSESINNIIPEFSADGRRVFFTVRTIPSTKRVLLENAVKVDVWNYKDLSLQSRQLFERYRAKVKESVYTISVADLIDPTKKQLIRLNQQGDKVITELNTLSSNYVLMVNRQSDNQSFTSSWWDSAEMPSIVLVSLKDGSRRLLKSHQAQYAPPPLADKPLAYTISPGGKYVIFFDNLGGSRATLQWYSYEIETGITRCLTKKIPAFFNSDPDVDDMPMDRYVPCGSDVGGWIGQDNRVLLYDRFDIWSVDINARTPAINLTSGYGRKHKVKFQIEAGNTHFVQGDQIILAAFNKFTKESGYFFTKVGVPGLQKLFMGPYQYSEIQKAKNEDVWLVKRQTASDPPNFFLFKEVNNFSRISNIQPQKKYNWLTAELMSWKTFDGRTGLGILYKPENFDSAKRYPIIFQYYQQRSNQLNTFIYPEYMTAEVNIPYFVSQGYLIFVPDIHYQMGAPGQSAYNYIVSAAHMLMTRDYVDKNHMGLDGHSFGGYETQFIVTHSKIFAAAEASSGWPDFISRYGAVLLGGWSAQFTTESERSRIGATLWQRRDLYIKNSPIFYANNVVTPLLMMNNQNDDQVPFSQGVEMFTALKRLGKKVWMLQYDEGTHIVFGKDAIDYTIRVSQFFDYYLKNASPPKWMVEGIPAHLKGIENGYELMPGKTP